MLRSKAGQHFVVYHGQRHLGVGVSLGDAKVNDPTLLTQEPFALQPDHAKYRIALAIPEVNLVEGTATALTSTVLAHHFVRILVCEIDK